jgi:hypothetical protein
MGAALDQAALGLEAGELPIGAVVVADGEIVTRRHRIGDVWNPAAGSVAPYRLPTVEGGVRREESVEPVRQLLRREPASPFARWATTLT